MAAAKLSKESSGTREDGAGMLSDVVVGVEEGTKDGEEGRVSREDAAAGDEDDGGHESSREMSSQSSLLPNAISPPVPRSRPY